jgi:hypothetical protein
MTEKIDLPALYKSADIGAAKAQTRFLSAVRWEIILLVLVASINSTRSLTGISPQWIALLLVVLSGILLLRYFMELDRKWYQCRALAESIKTSSWRYTMRAHPYGDSENVLVPSNNFRNSLKRTLTANKHLGKILDASDADGEQITESMKVIRSKILEERISFYKQHRILDQRSWYVRKSKYNERRQIAWIAISILVYVLAAISLFAEEIGFRNGLLLFDPLIVVVTGLLGWLQVKRHGELAASYNLTAHEIGMLQSNIMNIDTDEALSEFVNEAELAFSREHTQWTARKDS